MSEVSPTILWIRKDFRIQDNSALYQAIEAGGPVIPVYIWAPDEAKHWVPGGASKWWLHKSIEAFAEQWEALGGKLILRQGNSSLEVLQDLIDSTGATRVYWNRRYEPDLRKVDSVIKRTLREASVDVRSFNSCLLNEPHTTSTGTGQPYKVYTPYWKSVKDRELEKPVQPDLEMLNFPTEFPRSEALDGFNLLPKIQWYRSFYPHWDVGEAAAKERLKTFLEKAVEHYDTDRDCPDIEGTSCLSPYLHWGQIGPRQIAAALKARFDLRSKGPQVYLKEVYWREFAYNVLYHFPHTQDSPLREEYADFPWKHDDALIKAWQKGQTGYPIVDAGMRQLWETGWMHNRVRMIAASLLVKHLLQDWKVGAEWFWDTLVDADLASNSLGWQWSGGCGADAAPYFRVFNPIIQGKKFDTDGDYVRRFVPELRKLPAEYIHCPWEAPAAVLERAGVDLGGNYPEPVIEHSKGRERALKAFEAFKS